MTKQTPKSCSCKQCRFGKHTKTGHFYMKVDERSHRHRSKIELKKLGVDADVTPSPIGNYYD